jgi:UDP-N-acetylglucosamine 2-epimerase (non-hydrolysing)/GDP/UDP-N,N'-diacetylbacillosamine 2-epimerase (hydrolysing)
VSARRSRTARRRIAVVTGTRAEYGLLHAVMTAIDEHPQLDLQTVVTGIHLLPAFGRTVDDLVRDGWRIDARVPMQKGSDTRLDQAEGLARGVAGIARFLVRARSDVVVVLGDRIEAMAGALAAVTSGCVLAHIHGGDVAPGDFDDSLRHAITKLAHVHLAATRRAARRLIRLGERPANVHLVGAPGLDRLWALIAQQPPRRGRSGDTLIVYHASGRPTDVEERATTAILNAVTDAGLRRRIFFPNTDRGHSGVLRAIRRHERTYRDGSVEVIRSLPRDDYLRALLAADVLVGNSSSGFIEAPLAGTPVVDVGGRQATREPGGPAIVQCNEDQPAIRRALRRALAMHPHRGGRSIYGDGRTAPRIATILANLKITPALLKKQICY